MTKSTTAQLEQRFEALGTRRGGELYLHPSDAESLVSAAAANGLAVVGIESVILTDTSTSPLSDLIADFSTADAGDWPTFTKACNQASRAFLQKVALRPELQVTLVMLDEARWMATRHG